MNQDIKVDWASAEVHDGRVVVALDGKPKKDWKDAFKRTTLLLNHGTWEEVELKRGRISVRPVRPGDEDRLRHFLESVIFQANGPAEVDQQGDGAPSGETHRPEEEGRPKDAGDQSMTQRLRSFGDTPTTD